MQISIQGGKIVQKFLFMEITKISPEDPVLIVLL